jgi:hypothetical protein
LIVLDLELVERARRHGAVYCGAAAKNAVVVRMASPFRRTARGL